MELLTAFGVHPVLLLAQVVNFSIILFLMHRIFYRPFLRVFEERRRRIQESMRRADEIDKRFAKLAEEEQRARIRREKEGEAILKKAESAALAIRQRAQAEGAREMQQMIERARTKIAQEHAAMLAVARTELASHVVALTQLVLGKTLTRHDHQRLTNEAVKTVKANA